ncbi:MAG: hydroxylamine oxidoreductase, partial [Planctomycetes bacterium]|nr:hydroxylamine oxidoreductase [Planctomycetota bacterium]
MGILFLASLVLVSYVEQNKKSLELSGEKETVVTGDSEACVACHTEQTPGIVGHWEGSKHAELGVGCYECHKADEGDLDGWNHNGYFIATIVTPKDCGGCHKHESEEFQHSHHAKGGNILHSLDNLLAEVVEGHRGDWEVQDPHNPGQTVKINGSSFANSGCQQCHGSQVAILDENDKPISPWTLKIDKEGGKAVVTFDDTTLKKAKLKKNKEGKPLFHHETWPNTGIGRLNLDGSRGSCSACHSRHDFSPRRARQPENCGKCHLGPDHPQKEIYEESKHGVAYRD